MNSNKEIWITIITATYNSEETLEQALTSVVFQDYPYIEYVIIDGASTDGTLDIIKKYKGKIRLRWLSEPDNGIYDALNKGIDMATGDYIIFLGSDDSFYNSHTISHIVAQLKEEIDILSASVMVVDEKTKRQHLGTNRHVLDKETYYGGMIPHQGMVTKSSVLRKYKFDTSYKIAADYKFFLKCYYDDDIKIKYVDDPVVFYADSGSSSDVKKCWEEYNRIYLELGLPFCAPCINSPVFFKSLIRRALWRIGLLPIVVRWLIFFRNIIKTNFVWQKHMCGNRICRWCGRK